ncbi:MAG: type II/IV secretion system protein [Candidatus Kerfeldbacteria bacterium]|nr:type II/IV secretion system protein [Candidatus Kerfeldbacteria bacterium]
MQSPVGLQHVATPELEEALAEKMSQIALKEKEQETQSQASTQGYGYINLVGFPIGPETIALLPEAEARRLKVICFLKSAEQLRLGAVDPSQPEVRSLAQVLANKHRAHVEVYIISEHSFDSAIKQYARLPKIHKQVSGIAIAEQDISKFRQEISDLKSLQDKLANTSVTDTFTLLVAGALQARSSDIHIEAEEAAVRVRYRIDGVLTPAATLPRATWPRIISRIKLLAGLKLNITGKPQDGHITIYLAQEKIDVRVSTLPTAFGESVVMRILHSSAANISYDELGLRGRAYDLLKEEIRKPNGMIIATGPTGSGKTTTLYAIINQLNHADAKIITLEDPIEYKLEGINQSQVDWSKGYTFAQGLRSILRQDPDIVMVGEIRDTETVETAIQAALTGHLVLSTVHTNDAAGAVPRFLSMGAKPFLLAPALNSVVAQRLVRKICTHCTEEYRPNEATLERIKKTLATISKSSGYAVDPNKALVFHRGRRPRVLWADGNLRSFGG